MKFFIYNRLKHSFEERRLSVADVLRVAGRYMLMGAAAIAVYYLLFALVFNTDDEKRLIAENEYLQKEYAQMSESVDLLGDVIKNLEITDREIYNDIFHSDPPHIWQDADSLADISYLAGHSEEYLQQNTARICHRCDSIAANVDRLLTAIGNKLSDKEFSPTSIPSVFPIEGFTLQQTGASVGQKINPFYKSLRQHSGIDLLASAGTGVIASADGVVAEVVRDRKGLGNCIRIRHGGHLETVYAHLEDIYVSKGQAVKQGQKIAEVGSTGTVFAAALHYEVRKDGRAVDPVNYFFAELSPLSYRDMLNISLTTGQSMD